MITNKMHHGIQMCPKQLQTLAATNRPLKCHKMKKHMTDGGIFIHGLPNTNIATQLLNIKIKLISNSNAILINITGSNDMVEHKLVKYKFSPCQFSYSRMKTK